MTKKSAVTNAANVGSSCPEKVCTGCLRSKCLNDFHKNTGKKSGRDSRCKACVASLKRKQKKCKVNHRQTKAEETFTVTYEQHPDEYMFIQRLKSIIEDIGK